MSRAAAIPQYDQPDAAIARVPTGVSAFVGRTLKGPVNEPVTVASFIEFQQVFGALWQPSTLSYAVEQYFESGGRTALIVRIANSAAAATISLAVSTPGGMQTLRLIAVNPGSREYLRASVDYDGIPESDPARFNLILQRVRTPGSQLIEDQEIHRRVGLTPGAERFIANVLAASSMVRVLGNVPAHRPDVTLNSTGTGVGYINSNTDGNDGGPLTDYDVIGSATERTGLFALDRAGRRFDLLCIPPLSREQDVGLSALMVAARFCRDRQAMLVVDPPNTWKSIRSTLDALRNWPFRSENAVMYFPRVLAFDPLRGRYETFASCGAAAGIIARCDSLADSWKRNDIDCAILRPNLRPAMVVEEPDRLRLAQAGINTLQGVRCTAAIRTRTLACGTPAAADWSYFTDRRLALSIMASIERGTRWLRTHHNGPISWDRARSQVEKFLQSLYKDGLLAGSTAQESFFAICDERVNDPRDVAAGRVDLLFGFVLTDAGEFQTCMVTHSAGSSRVRPVTVNRQATSPERVGWEIETAILGGKS